MSVFAKPMPIIMGALMGLMMMWMLHGAMTGDAGITGWALIAFLGAHLAIALIIAVAVVFAARFSPRSHAWINRLHRPPIALNSVNGNFVQWLCKQPPTPMLSRR